MITAYRCHPFAVLRGGTIKGVIAELLGQFLFRNPYQPYSLVLIRLIRYGFATGRQDGMSSGKGGSMHIFTKTFFGVSLVLVVLLATRS